KKTNDSVKAINPIKAVKKALSAIKQKEPVHIQFSRASKLVMKQTSPLILIYRIPEQGKDPLISTLAKSEAGYFVGNEWEVDFRAVLEPLAKKLIDEYSAC